MGLALPEVGSCGQILLCRAGGGGGEGRGVEGVRWRWLYGMGGKVLPPIVLL